MSANVLQLIGVAQFFGASWFVFGVAGNLRQYIHPAFYVVSLIVGVSLGLSASVISFAIARIIMDLHSIRWNTDGYMGVREDDERKLLFGMANNIYAIACAVSAGQVPAPASSGDSAEHILSEPLSPEQPGGAKSPEQQRMEAADLEEASRLTLSGTALKLLWVLVGILLVGVVVLLIMILSR
jgi:hypothetical protein